MLQRFNSSLDEELLCGDGLWPRARLEEMNSSFVAAVEAAFQAGDESLVAARATVNFRTRKASALEGALEDAWNILCDKQGQMSASEIVGYVRARCPGVDVLRIRFGIEQRLRERGARW